MLSKLHHWVRTTPWVGRVVLRSIPDWAWKVSIDRIGKMEIRLRRNRGYWLRSPLSNDGFMMGALARLVHPGDVVYDIGANIGLYSRFLVQEFKASKVYAFEPMSENRPQLNRNLVIGGCLDQVVVLPFAVADEDGTAEFQVDTLTSNSGSLDAVTHGRASQSHVQYDLPPVSETVQVFRLDSLIANQNLFPPNVVKIDIEGAEAMALRGAPKLLSETKPQLVVELHGAEVAREVLQILWDCGYCCFGYLEVSGRHVYKKLEPTDLISITGKYSLHFIAATAQEEILRKAIETPSWIRSDGA